MSVEEKAQDLLEQNRVILLPVTEPGVSDACVAGHHGTYYVQATELGVSCTCDARGVCSHALAAMARWADEEKRLEAMPW